MILARTGRAPTAASCEHASSDASSSLYVDVRGEQRAAASQLGRQDGHALFLVEVRRSRPRRRRREQLADDLLVHRGVLTQVEPAQVGAEDLDRAAHRHRPRRPPAPLHRGAAARRSRRRGRRPARSIDPYGRRARHGAAGRAPRPSTSAAVSHSRACMPRRARRYGSSARNGESSPRRARRGPRAPAVGIDQAGRHRQLARQPAQRPEVVARSAVVACDVDGQAQDVGGDERIAVAVTRRSTTPSTPPAGCAIGSPSLPGASRRGRASSSGTVSKMLEW